MCIRDSAQRFNLHLPLKYRQLGEQNWRNGTTENISRSGMLFQAEEMIPANVQLEINLVLPVEIAGLSSAEVICRGEVVRTLKPGAVSYTHLDVYKRQLSCPARDEHIRLAPG